MSSNAACILVFSLCLHNLLRWPLQHNFGDFFGGTAALLRVSWVFLGVCPSFRCTVVSLMQVMLISSKVFVFSLSCY